MTNILIILTDDQRFDTIAALGNPYIQTPNMDRLVKRGTSFTHAHIMGGTCPAICMPSRAMLMSGRDLMHLGTGKNVRGRTLDPAYPCLPEHFRSAGYVTSHIGKWHQDRESHGRCFSTGAKIFGFKQGWYQTCNGHWHIPVHDYDPSAAYRPETGYNDPPITPFTAPFETCREQSRHSVEVFTDAACDFIRQHPQTPAGQQGQNFLLYLAHIAPHDPRQYPSRLRERYRAADIELPPNFAPTHGFDNGHLHVRDELLEAHPRRPEAIKQHIADYFALIHYIDEELGRIWQALEESGQWEDTFIVFAGDNGLAVGQHGLMGKQNMYDHSLRVPLVIAGPGIPAGQQCEQLCYLHDVYPTLCDLTGLPTPRHVQSRSLAPLFTNPEQGHRDLLHFAYTDCQRAIRRGHMKLIVYATDTHCRQQLFDLSQDPHEINNLIDDPSYAQTRSELLEALQDWRRNKNDRHADGNTFWSRFDKHSADSVNRTQPLQRQRKLT